MSSKSGIGISRSFLAKRHLTIPGEYWFPSGKMPKDPRFNRLVAQNNKYGKKNKKKTLDIYPNATAHPLKILQLSVVKGGYYIQR